jgi:hypothetical protein
MYALPCANSAVLHVKAAVAALKSEKVVVRSFGCREQIPEVRLLMPSD